MSEVTMPMPISQEEGEKKAVPKSATEEQIEAKIKDETAKTELSDESKQRAGRVIADAVKSAKQITSLGPSHPFWGEKGRWQEIERRPDGNHVEEIATVLQVVIPPMKETAEAYGRTFPPDATLDLALQHIVIARILGEAERIGGTSQELPPRLSGLKEDAPQDYLHKIQIISRLVPTLRQNAKRVREGESDNTLNEPLNPGVLQPERTEHQGFINTLGSAIVQLESLRAGT